MKRALALSILLLGGAAHARDALGIFDGWGAFKDDNPYRCFAIAEPVAESKGTWRPFASVGHWPNRNVRSQLHIRLSRERRASADVILTVGERRWRLVAGPYDAWAPSPRHDAFIIAKIRSARSMSVSSVAKDGGAFADTYRLKGAATAIDAAALGCVNR
jgi:hypothetical protein